MDHPTFLEDCFSGGVIGNYYLDSSTYPSNVYCVTAREIDGEIERVARINFTIYGEQLHCNPKLFQDCLRDARAPETLITSFVRDAVREKTGGEIRIH